MEASRPIGPVAPSVIPHHAESDDRLLGTRYRAATVGIVGLVSLIAYEAMGSATAMPLAAAELHGMRLYGFAFGGPLAASIVGMVLSGRWADAHSPMRSIRVGGACFITGLVIAAASTSMGGLLLGRVVTGLGSGLLAVALYAIVGRVYPAHLHARIFAAFAAAWVLPSLIAPGLSGTIAETLGWRWAIALVAVLAVPVLAMLPFMRLAPVGDPGVAADDTANRALPWALLAACGALALHVVGQGQAHGGQGLRMSTGASALLLVAAVLVSIAAARRLLPAGTLTARRGLPAAIALSGLSQGAFFAAEAFIPLLLHRQRGIPLSVAGLALTAGALSWSLGAMYRARIHQRVTATRLLRAGMTMLAGGIALSMLAIAPGVPFWIAPLGWAVAGGGMGLISPTLSILTLAMAPPGHYGRTGTSLRLSAAMATTSALAIGGAAFAALLGTSPPAAFAVPLGLAALMALSGAYLAGRTDANQRPAGIAASIR